ncbi:biotin-[acetyl-CoA-carboxylase] ligase [Rhinocladiella mackenziei CBS 650.93]|uniref:Biotin-[acetyl-CoA-carboxylase] ligase n=1 Tax=Rhinocladiella mackenziei CBS 650.93 TaxID=1442369 RepID=A0A0D2GVI5_9EURO|nr:biotin-[acetyl-CoA-carboxylase] ligase [Rhinocladiella mackenziei CBS 650.93]KIX02288.1 biotin-[acetyl-CoA-carboxylase] ligase [Rhinocladiella mackenziei CBS 650.93]
MATKRMNVLVYSGALTQEAWRGNQNLMLSSGNGSTVESVRHCLYTLRRHLAPHYAVIPVTGDMLIREPWTASCAALVIPGGADQGYCKALNGEGNRRIRQFVERGGIYIGFCAGGYYGSKRCEFEVGNKLLEVIGDRELAFYPGVARGCAFSGFVYHSEKGARAAELSVDKSVLTAGTVPNVFKSYYNGGGVFVDAPKYQDDGVEVLASYAEHLAVDSGDGAAAVVYCKVGQGAALLTGPHPEFVFLGKPADDWSLTKPRFAAANLEPRPDVPGFSEVITALADDEKHRMDFIKACLTKLGLIVSEEQNVPSLSHMHLSSSHPADTATVISSLSHLIEKDEHDEEFLKDENDTFHIVKPSTWKMVDLAKALPAETETKEKHADQGGGSSDRIVDYNTVVKQIVAHAEEYPESKSTPYFNHHAFYANLHSYQSQTPGASKNFGAHLLYGEVVTSTNTLLEKNTRLLRTLPQGFTATATVQVAGRGRGSNVWVSPAGSLMFSTVIRHPMAQMQSAPVVFVQYLAAMAIVRGIKSYDRSLYKEMPIKLKWPNDIFALDPTKASENGGDRNENYTKIGGILVNSHYNSKEYIAVCGIGLNTSNAAPTTSLNQLTQFLPHDVAPFTLEKLLARILTVFDDLYTRFLRTGFDEAMEKLYYDHWLHMDQIVTLDAEGGQRARIKGITRDYGLLIADELGWEDRETGRRWTLQSDANSFDFFKGLVKVSG